VIFLDKVSIIRLKNFVLEMLVMWFLDLIFT